MFGIRALLRMAAAATSAMILLAPLEATAGNTPLFIVGAEELGREQIRVSVNTDDAGNLVSLVVGSNTYSLEQVRAGANIRIGSLPLDKRVVVIHGAGIAPASGGDLDLDYLHNGMNGSRKHVRLNIHHNASGDWEVSGAGVQKIRKIYFTTNSFFGKTIGIDEAQISIRGPSNDMANGDLPSWLGEGQHGTSPAVENDLREARQNVPAPAASQPESPIPSPMPKQLQDQDAGTIQAG